MLVALFLPMVPVVISGFLQAGWAGWDWHQALLYAPASGVSQELYFRAALLPALERLLVRPRHALLVSSLMFSLFHAGMFTVAPPGAAVSALLVTFLAGLGWGWQVQRDRTVIWAMLHHALLQLILRLFAWM
jgi:membrane protease YdiL (CAAX protease family)